MKLKRRWMIGLVCALLIGVGAGAGITRAQGNLGWPRWVMGDKLVGVFPLDNGDQVIVGAQQNRLWFTYQYLDPGKEPIRDSIDWHVIPDRLTAAVCGRYVHVVAESNHGGGTMLTTVWEIPIEYHTQFMPIVCNSSHP